MNYEKLSPERFAEKLKAGEYDSLTGARRAIGKASWSEAAKNTARAAAEKAFGGAAAPAKAAPKKTAKAAPKKAAVAAPKGKPGRKPGSGKKAQAAATTSDVAVMVEHQAPSTFPIGGKQLTIAEIRKNPFHTIQLAEHGVASGTSVINALTEMKKQDANVDITEPMAVAVKTVKNSLELTSLVIQTLSEGADVPKAIANAVKQNGSTHAPETSPVPGEPVYTAPAAEA